jgi:hypothetical protein
LGSPWNIPVTKPLDKHVINAYSLSNNKGIDNIINPAVVDFFRNVRNVINKYGNIVKKLVMIGSAL